MQEFKKRGLSACLNLSIGYADNGQPQGLSLRMVGNGYFRKFVPLARQRCVEVAAPCELHVNKSLQTSRADDIRPYTIVMICNIAIAVYCRHLHLQICSMYARRYINGLFSMISFSKKIFRRRAVKSQIGAFYILHALCKQPKIKKQ